MDKYFILLSFDTEYKRFDLILFPWLQVLIFHCKFVYGRMNWIETPHVWQLDWRELPRLHSILHIKFGENSVVCLNFLASSLDFKYPTTSFQFCAETIH